MQLIALDLDTVHFELYTEMMRMCQKNRKIFVVVRPLCAKASLLYTYRAMDLLNTRAF